MKSASWAPVRDAVVLAAGNGDRFKNGSRRIQAAAAGARPAADPAHAATPRAEPASRRSTSCSAISADALRDAIERGRPGRHRRALHSTTPTGISRTASRCSRRARHLRDRRFALLMGDHLFEAAGAVAAAPAAGAAPANRCWRSTRAPAAPEVVAEATKVQLERRRGSPRSARSWPTTTRSTPACSSAIRRCSRRSTLRSRAATRRSAAASGGSPRAG